MLRATPDGANAFDPRFNMDDLFSPGTSGHFLGEVAVLNVPGPASAGPVFGGIHKGAFGPLFLLMRFFLMCSAK